MLGLAFGLGIVLVAAFGGAIAHDRATHQRLARGLHWAAMGGLVGMAAAVALLLMWDVTLATRVRWFIENQTWLGKAQQFVLAGARRCFDFAPAVGALVGAAINACIGYRGFVKSRNRNEQHR